MNTTTAIITQIAYDSIDMKDSEGNTIVWRGAEGDYKVGQEITISYEAAAKAFNTDGTSETLTYNATAK